MILLMRFVVSGRSMEPTFKPNQTLLVSSIPYFFREPKVGEVVVVKDPRDPSTSSGQGGRLLLKRIDKKRKEEYFVVGDNPKQSTDSKDFGWITNKEIIGKVI